MSVYKDQKELPTEGMFGFCWHWNKSNMWCGTYKWVDGELWEYNMAEAPFQNFVDYSQIEDPENYEGDEGEVIVYDEDYHWYFRASADPRALPSLLKTRANAANGVFIILEEE